MSEWIAEGCPASSGATLAVASFRSQGRRLQRGNLRRRLGRDTLCPSRARDSICPECSMSLGLPRGHNYLVRYDPDWPRLFEEERTRLRSALAGEAVDIQHVGSTAVSGLRAKPIIDIAMGAQSHTMVDQWRDAMASLGYDYAGDIGIPDHRIYGRDPDIRRFLVHVVDFDGARWRESFGSGTCSLRIRVWQLSTRP